MTDKYNVLLSFPRSGNTWVRYIAEFISRRPTCHSPIKFCKEGFLNKKEVISSELNLGVDINKKAILVKRHRFDYNWDDWNKDSCNLILIIRDYREAVIRHAFASRKENNLKEINKCLEGYIHCLSSYDNFDGNKMIIYYEDLMVRPKRETERLINFLGISKNDRLKSLSSNFNYHKRVSINNYKPGSMTRGSINRLEWHSTRVKPKIINKITETIKATPLYSKYLARYK